MLTIHKFPIPIQDEFIISYPLNARILCLKMQNNDPYIWILLDTSEEYVNHYFKLYRTGHEINYGAGTYFGTFVIEDYNFVGNLFEIFDEYKPEKPK